jgi:Lon-like protease
VQGTRASRWGRRAADRLAASILVESAPRPRVRGRRLTPRCGGTLVPHGAGLGDVQGGRWARPLGRPRPWQAVPRQKRPQPHGQPESRFVTTTDPMLQDPPSSTNRQGLSAWSWFLIAILVVVAALIVTGVVLVYRGAHGYYSIAPGTAPMITSSADCRAAHAGADPTLPNGKPCAQLVVPGGKAHGIDGSLYMVDVLVGPATPGEYLLSKIGLLDTFDKGMTLVPSREILGNTPPAQLNCQNDQAMQTASSSAAVVALRRLGYVVQEKDLGAQLDQIEPGSPAAAAGLQCNDIVVAVNGKPVSTSEGFAKLIRAEKPGQPVAVTVLRAGQGGRTQKVRVEAHLSGTPAIDGQKAVPSRPFLGVVFETRSTFTYPFAVTINVGSIGGPSAGLALTLGLLDVLSNGQLTGGHRVAATGTISVDGTVGDVGGVAQKTLAVRSAGAQIFLVPPQELKAAQSEAGSMKVYAVSTLQQALNVLESLGGHVPAPVAGKNGGG